MAPFNLNLPEIRLWLPFNQQVQVAISVLCMGGIAAYAYLGIFTPEAKKIQDARQQLQAAKRDYELLVQSAQTIEDQKRSIRKNLARISFFDLQEDPLPDLTAQNRAMVFLYQVADLAQVTGNKIVDMQIGEAANNQTVAAPSREANMQAGGNIAANALANPGQAIAGGGAPPPAGTTPSAPPAEPVKLLPITVTLQLRGTYPALKDFLQAVRDLSPLVQLDSFSAQMKKPAQAGQSTPGQPSEQTAPGQPSGGGRPGDVPGAERPGDFPGAESQAPVPSAAPKEDDGPFNTLSSQLVFKVNFLQKGS